MHRMATLPIKCQCGRLRGVARGITPDAIEHAICYCQDCQAFAHHLGRDADTLDANGGTELCQLPSNLLEFEQGAEQLACIRLTGRGPLRWYARCCNTPIGNTPPSRRVSFVGLIHTCVDGAAAAPAQAALGPVRARLFKESASGDAEALQGLPGLSPGSLLRLGRRALGSLVSGRYRFNPFFDAHGAPRATPRRLADDERAALAPYARS